jgi:hypothetical protein
VCLVEAAFVLCMRRFDGTHGSVASICNSSLVFSRSALGGALSDEQRSGYQATTKDLALHPYTFCSLRARISSL